MVLLEKNALQKQKKNFQWSEINDINTDRIKLYVTESFVWRFFLPLFVEQR